MHCAFLELKYGLCSIGCLEKKTPKSPKRMHLHIYICIYIHVYIHAQYLHAEIASLSGMWHIDLCFSFLTLCLLHY